MGTAQSDGNNRTRPVENDGVRAALLMETVSQEIISAEWFGCPESLTAVLIKSPRSG